MSNLLAWLLYGILVALIVSWCGPPADAAEPTRTCAVVTATAAPATWQPRTILERIYWADAACWRERALDAEARVATATTVLEVARNVPSEPVLSAPERDGLPLLWWVAGMVAAAAIGGLTGLAIGGRL